MLSGAKKVARRLASVGTGSNGDRSTRRCSCVMGTPSVALGTGPRTVCTLPTSSGFGRRRPSGPETDPPLDWLTAMLSFCPTRRLVSLSARAESTTLEGSANPDGLRMRFVPVQLVEPPCDLRAHLGRGLPAPAIEDPDHRTRAFRAGLVADHHQPARRLHVAAGGGPRVRRRQDEIEDVGAPPVPGRGHLLEMPEPGRRVPVSPPGSKAPVRPGEKLLAPLRRCRAVASHPPAPAPLRAGPIPEARD